MPLTLRICYLDIRSESQRIRNFNRRFCASSIATLLVLLTARVGTALEKPTEQTLGRVAQLEGELQQNLYEAAISPQESGAVGRQPAGAVGRQPAEDLHGKFRIESGLPPVPAESSTLQRNGADKDEAVTNGMANETLEAELVVRGVMPESIVRKDLEMLRLSKHFRLNAGDTLKQRVLQCQALECPSFGSCGSDFPGFSECSGLQYFNDTEIFFPDPPINCPFLESTEEHEYNPNCSHREDAAWHDKFHTQVVRIKGGIYVQYNGVTFNNSFVADRQGCVADDPELNYTRGQGNVLHVKGPVLSLLYFHGINFYHTISESVPTYLQAAVFMRETPRIPVLMHCWQKNFYKEVVKHIIGIQPEDMNFVCLYNEEVLYTDDLIQPVFQSCGKPSPSAQHFLRSRYYLPQDGLPVFNKGWILREREPMSIEEMSHIPDDWVVVYTRRPGLERRMEGDEEILKSLQELFGKERVHSFIGSPPILEAKKLLNRAIFLVGAHGAAMTNMVFMPVNTTVLEIRPKDYPNACFHHLASACKLNYYLVLGEGRKQSALAPNVPEVLGLLQTIASRVNMPLKR